MPESSNSYGERLHALVAAGNAAGLCTEVLRWRLQDTAAALTSVPVSERVRVLTLLPPRAAAGRTHGSAEPGFRVRHVGHCALAFRAVQVLR